jgi:hypothetical protein
MASKTTEIVVLATAKAKPGKEADLEQALRAGCSFRPPHKGADGMKLSTLTVGLLAVAYTCLAVNAQENAINGSSVKLQPLPRSLEVHLALRAAPPHLRSGASVFVLDPAKGYLLERQGTNGFTRYAQRTDYVREDYSDITAISLPSARIRRARGPLFPSSSTSSAFERNAS